MPDRNRRKNNRDEKKQHKLNGQIKGDEVRLVGDNVENGIVPLKDAMVLAKEMDMDLVLMNPTPTPVICKIMDYSKFLYESKKKPKQPKPKPMKEMRYRPNIDDHDYDFKLKHVTNFLEKGHKVKAYVFFRGREKAFIHKGEEILLKLAVDVEEVGKAENMPKLDGNKYTIILKPNSDKKKK